MNKLKIEHSERILFAINEYLKVDICKVNPVETDTYMVNLFDKHADGSIVLNTFKTFDEALNFINALEFMKINNSNSDGIPSCTHDTNKKLIWSDEIRGMCVSNPVENNIRYVIELHRPSDLTRDNHYTVRTVINDNGSKYQSISEKKFFNLNDAKEFCQQHYISN